MQNANCKLMRFVKFVSGLVPPCYKITKPGKKKKKNSYAYLPNQFYKSVRTFLEKQIITVL